VDAASYSNVRRFINASQLPPRDAVRIEELINYFSYDYPQPANQDPFSVNTEVGLCPWNENHYLVHIGLQGKVIPTENLPASNLVFLIDVSGSMNAPNKLPLLKSAFKLLVEKLRPQDKVSIVVYAGAAGLTLSPTSGDQKSNITASLENLQAGGSTAGGQGIMLAYKTARDHFIKGGNNRVILATDGDFNVGVSSNAGMEELIEKERESGVFLTVLGFGMGNYKDSKMEILADKGNGNYAYIDNILEAKKVFIHEFGGTLFTIAKDVKIQVEFNPAIVQSYRLIGYENRKLRDEEFNDDRKDAGELGSGHTVTALYEIIPVGVENKYQNPIDPLKYQEQKVENMGHFKDEMMTVKLRYKLPDEDQSKLAMTIIKDKPRNIGATSDNFRFSMAVAAYGMLLRDSEFKGDVTYDQVLDWARNSKGKDMEGYRAEFIRMVESTQLLSKS
jgi:Ca-activated chloride channel family protein